MKLRLLGAQDSPDAYDQDQFRGAQKTVQLETHTLSSQLFFLD